MQQLHSHASRSRLARRITKCRPCRADVIATAALFVALGGTGYAAAANSIGTRQLKDGAVTGAKVKNGTIGWADLTKSARNRMTGKPGPPGPDGPPGQSGSSAAVGRFNNGPLWTTNDDAPLLSLDLPAGNYVILAKATVFQTDDHIECRAVAGVDFDRAKLGNGDNSDAGTHELETLTVLHSSTTPFTASLRCQDQNPNERYELTDLKITALKVAALSNTPG